MKSIQEIISEKLGINIPEKNLIKLPKEGIDDENVEIFVTRIKGDLIVKVCVYDEMMIYISTN